MGKLDILSECQTMHANLCTKHIISHHSELPSDLLDTNTDKEKQKSITTVLTQSTDVQSTNSLEQQNKTKCALATSIHRISNLN